MRALLSRLPVAVIGGGSAGISAVAALAQTRSVLWYDAPAAPAAPFSAGELQLYRSVPANTKVDKLLGPGVFGHPALTPWIEGSPAAAAALEALRSVAVPLPELEPFDPSPDGWVGLDVCHDVFARVAEALVASERVTCVARRVESVRLDTASSEWTLVSAPAEGAARQTATAAALVLATGGSPRQVALPPHAALPIPLNAALCPTQLADALGAPSDATVAVIGNSHTAVVILDHCRSLGVKKVKVIGRRPVRHAQWVADVADYRYTMSGLKGLGSLIGRVHLDGSVASAEAFGEGWERAESCTALTDQQMAECLADCTHVVMVRPPPSLCCLAQPPPALLTRAAVRAGLRRRRGLSAQSCLN